jgi:hypothetical protein
MLAIFLNTSLKCGNSFGNFPKFSLDCVAWDILFLAKWGIFTTKNNRCPKYESRKINIILLYYWLPTRICVSNLSHIFHEKSFV